MESSHGLYARRGSQWLRYLENKPKDDDTLFQSQPIEKTECFHNIISNN